MKYATKKRGEHNVAFDPELISVSEDVVVGATHWLDDEGKRRERYQVLTVQDGKIVDMQDCKTRRQAERFANSRRARR